VPAARAGSFFSGTLLDHDGTPVGGAAIQIVQGGAFQFPADTRTDPGSGSFRVGPLPEGAYALTLNASAQELPPLHVRDLVLATAEEKDLGTLRLPASGKVSVHARFPDGTVPKPAFVGIVPDGEHSEAAWLELASGAKAMRVGRCLVRVFGKGFAWQERSCVVEAGKETRLEFVLERGVQRQLVFPVPEPPGWDTVQKLRMEVRRSDGGVVIREEYAGEDLRPFYWWPALTVGRYGIKVWADDRAPMQGQFVVESLTPSLEPIRVRLD
jgi:hypothetical protein